VLRRVVELIAFGFAARMDRPADQLFAQQRVQLDGVDLARGGARAVERCGVAVSITSVGQKRRFTPALRSRQQLAVHRSITPTCSHVVDRADAVRECSTGPRLAPLGDDRSRGSRRRRR
jgi:hypothetical protein